jgi:hypothetical protein
MKFNRKLAVSMAAVLCLAAVGAPQIKEAIKILGVGVAVKQFGPDINKAINKLAKHTDTPQLSTKVVPILSIGIGTSPTVGAAQVMGPKRLLDQVQAVAQPQAKDIKKVDGVGVSGIVDLKL